MENRNIKKTLIASIITLGLFSTILVGYTKNLSDEIKEANNRDNIVKTQQTTEYNQFNDFFTPAFQLIWNDFSDKFVKGDITFIGGNPEIADDLNQKSLKESMVSKNDLYKTIGNQTLATKKRIEKELKRKFNENSVLLDNIQWMKKADDKYVLYAMFKKDILFKKALKDLNPRKFNNSNELYKYFGTTFNSDKYKDTVYPVYYDNNCDFAVKLATKKGDEIFLITENSDKKVLQIWDNFYKNKLSDNSILTFDESSELYIPNINFKKRIEYKDIEGKSIENSKYIIGTALEDIEFSLDKNGAKIKNEAVMSIMKTALIHHDTRKIYKFDKPFVIFIRAKNAKVPYFALKIKDTKYLQKAD